MRLKAVITADIVNSTLLTNVQNSKLVSTIVEILQPHKFEFYRGDSFQVYLNNLEDALEIVLKTRLAARMFTLKVGSKYNADVRAGIGIGRARSNIKSLNIATDEVFVLSGRSLDEINKSDRRLIISTTDETANTFFRVLAYYIDHIFAQLTTKQAEVLFLLLSNNNQTEIAKKLKKSQATINKQLRAAHWPEIEKLLMEFKFAITQFNLK